VYVRRIYVIYYRNAIVIVKFRVQCCVHFLSAWILEKRRFFQNDRSITTIIRWFTALCSSYFLHQALPYKYPLPASAYYFMLHDIIRTTVPSSDMSFAVDCLNFALLFVCTRVFHLALGISAQYYKVHRSQ